MNDTVNEWISKAEGDYATARRELRAAESPNFDAVCFHAQQCIEKLMKALLIRLGVVPPKTHDLVILDRLLTPVAKGGLGQWKSFASLLVPRWPSVIPASQRTRRRPPSRSVLLRECAGSFEVFCTFSERLPQG